MEKVTKMTKKTIAATIEIDVYNELKAKNLNISQTIEKLLKDYLATLASPEEQQRGRQAILDAQEQAENEKEARNILTYNGSQYLLRAKLQILREAAFSDERIKRILGMVQKLQEITPKPNIKIVREPSDFQPAEVPAQSPGSPGTQ